VLAYPFHTQLSPQTQAVSLAVGLVVAATIAVIFLRRSRPSQEAIEQARRARLSLTGRITDGSLVDTTTLDGSFLEGASRFQNHPGGPEMLLFHYRIAGVAYEAVQDVSALPDQVRGLRIDLPIQVRYDHNNPADSIVVAEEWSGLQIRHDDSPEPKRN
jgi:hypothetical protein